MHPYLAAQGRALLCLSFIALWTGCSSTEPGRVAADVVVSAVDTLRSIGDTVRLTGVVRDANQQAMPDVPVATWESSNSAVVTVAGSGLVTAVGVGSATITARAGTASGSSVLTVRQRPFSIALQSPTDTLRALGATGQFAAVVEDSGGSTIESPDVQWSSSDASVVTIDIAQGLAAAVSNGSVYIRILANPIKDSLPLVVRQRIDATKSTLSVTRPLLFVDDTVTVTLQGRDANGSPMAFGGSAVGVGYLGGTGTGTMFGLVDRADGTYTARFAGSGVGSAGTVSATIDGMQVSTESPTLRVVGFNRIAVAGSTLSGAPTTTGGYSCGIITTGDMYCWGIAWFGVRGDNSAAGLEANPTPTRVSGTQQWTEVVASTYFACAIASGGAAYCWGDGDVGQIGNGTSGSPPDARVPTAVSGGNTFASVAIGSSGACAVTVTNNAMCWGNGIWGRLGNGSETLSAVPVTVSGGFAFASVGTSYSGTCGIAASAAYCWGHSGVLGLGGAPAPDTCGGVPCARTPFAVAGGRVFKPIIARDGNMACAVATDDKAYCWGSGYLGNGMQTGSDVPVAVNGGLSYASLTAGDGAICGTVVGGAAYCWGDNRNGRLGNNSTTNALEPVLVSGGHTFTQLSMSQDHTCGVSTDGNAYCWGGNDKGELGTRSVTPSLVPVRVRLFAP